MAKCKLCRTEIPDGSTYCEACLEKNAAKTNESYLDSLLNSVINTAPATETVYKKSNQKDRQINSSPLTKASDENQSFDDMLSFDIDFNDLEDFEEYDITNDLEDSIEISEEDLFGDTLREEEDQAEDTIDHTNNPESVTQEAPDLLSQSNINEHEIANFDMDEEQDPILSDLLNQLDISGIEDEHKQTDNKLEYSELGNELSQSEEHISSSEYSKSDEQIHPSENNLEEELSQSKENNHIDELYKSVLNQSEDFNQAKEHDQTEDPMQTEEDGQMEELSEEETDDLLDLLNQISSEDPASDDIQAISELLSGKPSTPKQANPNGPSDVGEVFSDALKVVSSLDDPDIDELTLDFLEEKPKGKNKKNKKAKKSKNKKEKGKKPKKTSLEETAAPKKSLIDRIFGNVEEEESKKKTTIVNDELAAASVKSKKKKNRKGKSVSEDNEVEDIADQAAKQKKESKGEVKKEKKEKKKKDKEIMQVIDEIDEDEGRINRVGASIVFLFFGILVTVLLIGTNIFSYSLSIHNATDYFSRHKYTQAYNEVYGIDLKDEDIELYDKIQTVMFVNKQLNSYNNYYLIGKYPEALDSLLKGLSRYDKYIELATMLGIDSDLDYVRDQIIAELNRVYHITEKEALEIINSDTKAQYSVKVYNVVLEKMNN